jgi:hypothetical protein
MEIRVNRFEFEMFYGNKEDKSTTKVEKENDSLNFDDMFHDELKKLDEADKERANRNKTIKGGKQMELFIDRRRRYKESEDDDN